jgi:uncharacterized protein
MKKSLLLTILAAIGLAACGQTKSTKGSAKNTSDNNTLLWRISGNGLARPSYLFGTMHMICADDIIVSDSLSNAIKRSDKVYLEVDMEDMMGMMMKLIMDPKKLTMSGDTTLSDLLTPEDYQKVKAHFAKGSMGQFPFTIMEKFKPMIIQMMMMDQSKCDNTIVMEQLVMEEAKKHSKDIDGLETIDYQMSIFDKIPYNVQAKGLVKMTESNDAAEQLNKLTEVYRKQELSKMEDLTKEDESVDQYAHLLLYDRNMNWVNQLKEMMAKNALVVAVGAGHLPGDKGVISLLRKAGYKVEPVKNDMIKKKVKEI